MDSTENNLQIEEHRVGNIAIDSLIQNPNANDKFGPRLDL